MSDDIKTFNIILFMIHYSKGVSIRVSELGCPNEMPIVRYSTQILIIQFSTEKFFSCNLMLFIYCAANPFITIGSGEDIFIQICGVDVVRTQE